MKHPCAAPTAVVILARASAGALNRSSHDTKLCEHHSMSSFSHLVSLARSLGHGFPQRLRLWRMPRGRLFRSSSSLVGPSLPQGRQVLTRTPPWTAHSFVRHAVSRPDTASASRDQPAGAGGPKQRQRRRLDEVCLELHPSQPIQVIQSWIIQGKVLVDGRAERKAGAQVKASQSIEVVAEEPKYVCRGGLKLERALDHFQVDVGGLVALDSGLSTGGFTDCLLQRGAAKVYGVDVGYGQVAEKIRTDPRVVVMERTNVRLLTREDIGEDLDICTLDLSFISVAKVVPALCDLLRPSGQLVVLIKPQFEAGKARVEPGGVVRDPAVHRDVVERVVGDIEAQGFVCRGCIESPILGDKSKNKEFLAHFVRTSSPAPEGPGANISVQLGQPAPH